MSVAIDPSTDVEGVQATEVAPPCMALVPMAHPVHAPESIEQLARPDPSFVTQLIATAEHVPQTCALRRATPAVAQAAYGLASDRTHIKTAGREMQQIV